ncbi:MAG: SRPBCC family protein [Gammaproteobacteria bacterium]
MRLVSLFLAILGFLLATFAAAVEINHAVVSKNGGVFHLEAETLVEAPPDFVYEVLTDFDRFHNLAAGIAATRYLEPDEKGGQLGYTKVAGCVFMFCKSFEKVERIWATPKKSLVTIALPERSDFRVYATRWRVIDADGKTRLAFEANMQPDFWVPPLIGAWAVERKLRLTALEMGQVVEYLYANGIPISALPRSNENL